MATDDYILIIKQLKNIDTIDVFVTQSIEFFLKKTNDFDIICSLNEVLYTQLALFITYPDNLHIREILLLQHGKKYIRSFLKLIKQGILENIVPIIHYIKHDLALKIPTDESIKVLESLEKIYNSMLELHYEFTNS